MANAGSSYAGEIRVRSRIDTSQLNSDTAKVQAQMDKIVHKMHEVENSTKGLSLDQALERAQRATRGLEDELTGVRARLEELRGADAVGAGFAQQTREAEMALAETEQKLIEIQNAMNEYTANGGNIKSSVYKEMQADLAAAEQTAAARDRVYRQAQAAEESYTAKREADIARLEQQEQALTDKIVTARERERLADEKVTEYQRNKSAKLDELQEKYRQLNANLEETEKKEAKTAAGMHGLARATHASGNAFTALGKRILGMLKTMFIFQLISKGLQQLRTLLSQVLQTVPEVRQSIGEIKGALLTAFAPIWETLQPIVIGFFRWLAKACQTIAAIISALFGKTLTQSTKSAQKLYNTMNKTTKATKKTKKEVKELTRELAGFDEITQLSENGLADGAIGQLGDAINDLNSADMTIKPIFDTSGVDTGFMQRFTDWLDKIKQSPAFQKLKEKFMQLKDKWDEFVASGNWDKVKGWLQRVGENLLTDIFIITGDIFDIAGDIVDLTGDIAEGDGWGALNDTKNLLTDILFLGLDPIAAMIDHILGTDISGWLAGIKQKIKDFDLGAWAKHASEDVSKYMGEVKSSIETTATDSYNWFVDKLINPAKKALDEWGVTDTIKTMRVSTEQTLITIAPWVNRNLVEPLKSAFSKTGQSFNEGLILPISRAIANWDAAQSIGDLWREIKNMLGGVKAWVSDHVFGPLKTMWKDVLNWFIDKLNSLIRKLNEFHVDMPDWLATMLGVSSNTSFGLNLKEIPRLAQGAVIPPNAPFLAMLGDQKRGTNIEAPLDTIIEAFKRAQSTQPITIRFEGNLAQLGRVLNPVIDSEKRRLGMSFASSSLGG